MAEPCVARRLFHLRDATGREERGAARVARRDALTLVSVGELVDIRAELGVEIRVVFGATQGVVAEASHHRAEAGEWSRHDQLEPRAAAMAMADAAPFGGFDRELLSAGRGELVELCFAVVVRGAPGGVEPAFLFHAMEGGEEGAGLDDEGAGGDLGDAVGDAEAVQRLEAERFENEDVERALEERGRCGGSRHRPRPIECLYERVELFV